MNHLMIFAVFMILSLHFESLLSQFHKQNSSDDKQILAESFKQKLLKELGLSSAPNVSALKAPEIPAIYKYLVETENRKLQEPIEEEDDFHAKTKQIFLFPEKVPSVTNLAGKNYAFKSNPRYLNLDIKSASLWIHITEDLKSAVKAGDDPQVLNLYKAFKGPGKEVRSRELFHSEQLNKTGWYSVEVSVLIKEWFSMHIKSYLSLDVAINGALSLEVGDVDSEAAKQWRPFLVVNTEEKKQLNRKRRHANLQVNDECDPRPPKTCCRHSFVVDFQQIRGLEFILLPRMLNVYACAGSCQSLALYEHVRRAKVLKKIDPTFSGENHTCCVPKQLGPINFIYYLESGSVHVEKIHIRVLSCSCFI